VNVNWITFRKPVTAKKVLEDLTVIINRRFGLFGAVLKTSLKTEYSDKGYWEFNHEDFGYVSITQTSGRRITFKAGADDSYAETVLRTELGALYDGMCASEGVEGRWKPEPEKYSSREAYEREMRP
jgi:hypothetical protein